jgi:hypothetical protein
MTDQLDKRQAAARTRAAARKQFEEVVKGQDRITIIGPQPDGTYIIEFRTAAGETLSISITRGETAVIEYFQKRMPNGLVVWAS